MFTKTPNETERTRTNLNLPINDYRWWAASVERIRTEENLLHFSFTGLLHRIAAADLDLSENAIRTYQSTPVRHNGRHRKK